MTKVVLITSGQPSANPRMVKEAITLSGTGYDVTVIYAPLSPWADGYDSVLFAEYPKIKWIRAGYSLAHQQFRYKYARLRRKLNEFLFRKTRKTRYAERGLVLFAQELFAEAKKHRADIYVGHNMGALPTVVKLANVNNALCCFDAEDFHRGEHETNSLRQQMVIRLENSYFPKLDKVTAAAPLIGKAYQDIFPMLSPIVINNVFSIKNASEKELITRGENKQLKLFWFSQIIGKKRGVETVIAAIGILKEYDVTLSLLGNCTNEMKAYLLALAKANGLKENCVMFLQPVAPNEIFKIASSHDIGLATEVPYCLNREVCLTNKLFTYLLAGNAIIASDTRAQKLFLDQNPDIGSLFHVDDAKSIAVVLEKYLLKPSLLQNHREKSLALANNRYNWEIESRKFLEIIRK